MKKVKTVRAKTAREFINAMKKHKCKGKNWLPADQSCDINYVCEGCGFRVSSGLVELMKEKKMLGLFWKSLKTLNGRVVLGQALNYRPMRLVGRIPGL